MPEPLFRIIHYEPEPPYVHFPDRGAAKELALVLAIILLGIILLIVTDFKFRQCSWVELKALFFYTGVITLVASIYPFCVSLVKSNIALTLGIIPPLLLILLGYIIHYTIDKKHADTMSLQNFGFL